MKTVLCVLAALLLSASSAKGESYDSLAIVPISSLINAGLNPVPDAGDTVFWELSFLSRITGSATLNYRYPGLIGPLDQGLDLTRDSVMLLDSGVTYNVSIPVKINADGYSQLTGLASI